LLYANDLVVIAETEDDLIKRLNEWKDNMENRGIRVATTTTTTATTVLRPSWTMSGTTRVSRHQKGKTNLDLLEQEIVSGSVISSTT